MSVIAQTLPNRGRHIELAIVFLLSYKCIMSLEFALIAQSSWLLECGLCGIVTQDHVQAPQNVTIGHGNVFYVQSFLSAYLLRASAGIIRREVRLSAISTILTKSCHVESIFKSPCNCRKGRSLHLQIIFLDFGEKSLWIMDYVITFTAISQILSEKLMFFLSKSIWRTSF